MNFHQLPTKHVDQISLNVSNLDRSISFYEEILAFKVLENNEREAILSFDGKTPVLTLVVPDNVAPINYRNTGLYHVAYLLPSRKDLADCVFYFINKRIPVQGASDHGVSEAFYLADPDGNGIEIYADRHPDQWRWSGSLVNMVTEPMQIEDLLTERSEEGWKGCPEDTVIGHVHLQVDNLKPIREFYIDLLQFDVVAEYGPQALFISDQKYHHHIALNIWHSSGGNKKKENEVGLNWYSIKMTEDEREKIKSSLEQAGYMVIEENNRYIVEDPAGITIHF